MEARLLLALLVFAAFLAAPVSGEAVRTEQNGLSVTWYPVQEGISHFAYNISVENLDSKERRVDLSSVLSDASFPLEGLMNLRFYELVNSSYVAVVPVYGNESFSCVVFNNETQRNESSTCWRLVEKGTEEELKSKLEWRLLKPLATERSSKKHKERLGARILPKKITAGEGITWYRLEFDAPIAETPNGWGSTGKAALEIDGFEYHPWWSEYWEYKRAITVNNTLSATTLTDYQVPVSLDTQSLISQGKMRPDCGDVRFTDIADTEVSYWLESGCNTNSTKLWVRVPVIPAGSTTTINMYYGNPSALPASNANDVFRFNIELTTAEGWIVKEAVIETAARRIKFTATDNYERYAAHLIPGVEDFEIRSRALIALRDCRPQTWCNPVAWTVGLAEDIGKLHEQNNSVFAGFIWHDRTGRVPGLWSRRDNVTYGYWGDKSIWQWNFNTWYYTTLRKHGSTLEFYVYSDEGRTNLLYSMTTANASLINYTVFYGFGNGWAGYTWETMVGYSGAPFILLKYAAPEPTISIGGEEVKPPPAKSDLAINNNDITFPLSPREGEFIRINATIHNIGEVDASNVTVHFYDGDPSINGTLIASETIAIIPAGSSETASALWTAPCGTREFYVKVDPFNAIYEADEGNNVASKTFTTAYCSSRISLTLSPQNVITSLGGSVRYKLKITNGNLGPDNFSVSIEGLPYEWYRLSSASMYLVAGEVGEVDLDVSIPETGTPGDYNFNVSVNSQRLGHTKSASAQLRVLSGPIIYDLSPPDGVRLGSEDVLFTWRTSANSTTEVYLRRKGEANYSFYEGEDGVVHSLTVSNLTRNTNYSYYIRSCSSADCTLSGERGFYIDNGIIFTRDVYYPVIKRNYDQRVGIEIKNTDEEEHEVLVQVTNPYEDLIVGFVGEGSTDTNITLSPGESRSVTLAIHAQDAALGEYGLLFNLTTHSDVIYDYTLAHVTVAPPEVNFSFAEVAYNPATLERTYEVVNSGEDLSDFTVYADENLRNSLIFQPIIEHYYLHKGETIRFKVYPVLSFDYTGVSGNITATGAGVSKSLYADFGIPGGKDIYLATLQGPSLSFYMTGWYCTNNPNSKSSFYLPAGFSASDINSVKLTIDFYLPWEREKYREHNTYVYVNGQLVGGVIDSVPEGTMEFNINPSYMNYASSGVAKNTVELRTEHMNGGHYVVAADMRVNICTKTMDRYVIASSQEEANQLAWQADFITIPSSSIAVDILSPTTGSNLNQGVRVLIQASVTGDNSEPELDCSSVIAAFSSGDAPLGLLDDGRHGDGSARDGVYANTWTPQNPGSTTLTVTAKNCKTYGSTSINLEVIALPTLSITAATPSSVANEYVYRQEFNLTANISNPLGSTLANLTLLRDGAPIPSTMKEVMLSPGENLVNLTTSHDAEGTYSYQALLSVTTAAGPANITSNSIGVKIKPPQVVLLIIDGANYQTFQQVMNDLNRINSSFRWINDSGVFVENAIGVFPSITPPSHTAILTGAYPGTSGVPDMRWYNKNDNIYRDYYSLSEMLSIPLPEENLNEVDLSAETIYTAIRPYESYVFMEFVWKNMTDWDYSVALSCQVLGCDADVMSEIGEYLYGSKSDERPDLLVGWLYETDENSHRYGPYSSEASEALKNVDDLIWNLKTELEKRNKLQETILIVTSDHGQSSVNSSDTSKVINVETLLEPEYPTRVNEPYWEYCDPDTGVCYKDDTDVIVTSNGRVAELYLVGNTHTDIDVLRSGVLDILYNKSEIEIILYKTDAGWAAYPGKDGYILYPKAQERIDGLLNGDQSWKTGDIIVIAREGYEIAPIDKPHLGDHGSLIEEDSRVPLLMIGPGVLKNQAIPSARLVDVSPTIADVLKTRMPLDNQGEVLGWK